MIRRIWMWIAGILLDLFDFFAEHLLPGFAVLFLCAGILGVFGVFRRDMQVYEARMDRLTYEELKKEPSISLEEAENRARKVYSLQNDELRKQEFLRKHGN